MNVEQIMSDELITVEIDDTIRMVKRLFEKHTFHHLLVVEGGRLVGIISDRDLMRSWSPFIGKISERSQDRATLKRCAHQIMTRKPVTAVVEMEVRDAAKIMLENSVSCLPVIQKNGRAIGIVTWRDVLRGLCDGNE